jgi:Holliday junction resolvasome RuvABC endonuclease subunit
MIVVGLDLSLTSTGWSCLNETGNFTTGARGAERLHVLSDELTALLYDAKPTLVVVENYSFGSKNSQAHAIGEWGGVARLAMWRLGTPYVEVPPTCRAKFATGKGNAGKGEVMSAVSARTGIVWSGKGAEDRCDAWVLEEMGRTQFGEARHDWPALNLSALDKVDWNPVVRTS